ncbi:hypothetical protein HYZ78_00345 [Candidatus Microgenomates bacterium]|nr:hypothetical protein [Candidatus Microgenomates bacterium]
MENILAQTSLGKVLPEGSMNLALIFGGVFLVLLLLAWTRHHMLGWTLKGAHMGVFFGIVLTLVVEALIIVGGKTTLAEILKNNAVPQVVRETVSRNLQELAANVVSSPKTLGAQGMVSAVDVAGDFQELSEGDQTRVRELVCKPPVNK